MFCYSSAVFSQVKDTTVLLTLTQAKAELIKSNLTLLASHYDVDIAEADLIQSKLWNNPLFVWNQDLYSVELNQYFNYRNQRLIQIEQMISIAGKHTNTVKLSKINLQLSKLMLQDALRSLLYETGEVYYELQALQEKQKIYTDMLEKYQRLINNSVNQLKVGAISNNEVLRLKSELTGIKAEAIANLNDVANAMKSLRILLNLPEHIRIVTQAEPLAANIPSNTEELIQLALESRPDYLLSKKGIAYEKQNYKLQKSLAVPDINLGYQPHDKGSNYVRPYTGLVVEMQLPLYDRNQGNIKASKARISQAELKNQLQENTIRNEVATSYQQVLTSQYGLSDFSDEFLQNVEELNTNANSNFDRRNISMLEYIDLQRIYMQNQNQYIDLRNQLLRSVNQLNFTIGKDITQ